MAMRRPRIKPVANIQLNSKRKAKAISDVKTNKISESGVNRVQEVGKQVNDLLNEQNIVNENVQETESGENTLEVSGVAAVDTTANENNLNYIVQGNNDKRQDKLSESIEEASINGNRAKDKTNAKEIDAVNNAVKEQSENANEEIRYNNGEKEQSIIVNDEVRTNNAENEPSKICKDKVNDNNAEKEQAKNDKDEVKDSDAFKCPPKVVYQRSISHTYNSVVDDVFYSDIEESALQMDLEKSQSSSCSLSSKNLTRQRIRPTPHFGQRRNSFVGPSSSPHSSGNEDHFIGSSTTNADFVQTSNQTRRERHNSASFTGNNQSSSSSHHHQHHTVHKYLPSGIANISMGRIRTESGCSTFSDTNAAPHKSRKTEDSKQNIRKDFEARFHNGVPEKSTIKMYDLIYYNPATNPMEQKQNSNVKIEQSETSAKDVKPFSAKLEKEADASADGEDVPVPQLKLNAKGELILDDKSLVIETTAEQEARKVLANSSLIYLDENTGMNGFYSRQKRTREWLPAETIKFYRCLQNVGTDFSLMVSLFPNRTRRDLKLKFKKEERKNCHLINKALLYPKQFDLESLKQLIEEEEKLRENQKTKTKEKKEKKEKKRKICTTSISKRILLNEEIYQNENSQKPKKARKHNTDKDKCVNLADSNDHNYPRVEGSLETDNSQGVYHTETEGNRKQIKTYGKNKKFPETLNEEQITKNGNNDDLTANKTLKLSRAKRPPKRTSNKGQKEEIIIIKEEIIKIENKQESNQTISTETSELCDVKQLQTEIDELLAVDIQYDSNSKHKTSTENILPDTDTHETECHEEFETSPCPVSNETHYKESYCDENSHTDKYEHRQFVNLEDGSINVYSRIEEDISYITSPSAPISLPSPSTRSQTSLTPMCATANENELLKTNTTAAEISEQENINNDACSSVITEHQLNEEDIQAILTEIAEGSLVLVSTLDPDDSDKVLNEIYMMDKNTGELCEEPLDIPENIVQCIITVVNGAQI